MEWYVLVLMLSLPSLSWADCSEQCLKCALQISDSPLNLLVRSFCCVKERKKEHVAEQRGLRCWREEKSERLGLKNKQKTLRRVCLFVLLILLIRRLIAIKFQHHGQRANQETNSTKSER